MGTGDPDDADHPSISVNCIKCGTPIQFTYTSEEAGLLITIQETHDRPDTHVPCYGSATVVLPVWSAEGPRE
jgi:hypothetical protein